MQYTEFGAEARKQMLLRGIGLNAFAKELNISPSYLCEILKGTRNGEKYRQLIAARLDIEMLSMT